MLLLADQFSIFINLLVSFLLGGIIGWEREYHGHDAGTTTFGFIALGACSYAFLSKYAGIVDQTRIAAQVVSSIGFLGGGVIFRDANHVKGLTTAASLWCSCAVGLAIGFELHGLAIGTTIIVCLANWLKSIGFWPKLHRDSMSDQEILKKK
jgi:putative Mg2+ transporter-C (MgtC) family protein